MKTWIINALEKMHKTVTATSSLSAQVILPSKIKNKNIIKLAELIVETTGLGVFIEDDFTLVVPSYYKDQFLDTCRIYGLLIKNLGLEISEEPSPSSQGKISYYQGKPLRTGFLWTASGSSTYLRYDPLLRLIKRCLDEPHT